MNKLISDLSAYSKVIITNLTGFSADLSMLRRGIITGLTFSSLNFFKSLCTFYQHGLKILICMTKIHLKMVGLSVI